MSARITEDKLYIKTTAEEIRQKLKLLHLEAVGELNKKHPHFIKYLREKGIDPGKIREHSAKLLSASFLTGSLLFSSPLGLNSNPTDIEISQKHKKNVPKDGDYFGENIEKNILNNILPSDPRPLNRNEEKYLEQVFQQLYGVKTKANLGGEHLNTTYGFIGIEQHLRRYPGDTLSLHGEKDVTKEGLAPGLGAWGYFAPTKDKLTDDLKEKEKWYAVVQTLYLPDWNKRQPYLKDWYKYRKVLIVNTQNGNAVVAAISDSGPAAWTGKQYGGSPEVMQHLGGERYTKGKVVIFFVDDPLNNVPLGPVSDVFIR